MTDPEKTDLLARLFDGDPHIAVELRALVRKRLGVHHAGLSSGTRTAGELRSRARTIRLACDRVNTEKAAAVRRRQAEEAEEARLVRINALARRGQGAWQEAEAEIERRLPHCIIDPLLGRASSFNPNWAKTSTRILS